MLETAEPGSLVEEGLLQLPVPQSNKVVCEFSAGPQTRRLLPYSVLILFTALADQNEGLLVRYTSVGYTDIHLCIQYGALQQLVLETQVYLVSVPCVPGLHLSHCGSPSNRS